MVEVQIGGVLELFFTKCFAADHLTTTKIDNKCWEISLKNQLEWNPISLKTLKVFLKFCLRETQRSVSVTPKKMLKNWKGIHSSKKSIGSKSQKWLMKLHSNQKLGELKMFPASINFSQEKALKKHTLTQVLLTANKRIKPISKISPTLRKVTCDCYSA